MSLSDADAAAAIYERLDSAEPEPSVAPIPEPEGEPVESRGEAPVEAVSETVGEELVDAPEGDSEAQEPVEAAADEESSPEITQEAPEPPHTVDAEEESRIIPRSE